MCRSFDPGLPFQSWRSIWTTYGCTWTSVCLCSLSSNSFVKTSGKITNIRNATRTTPPGHSNRLHPRDGAPKIRHAASQTGKNLINRTTTHTHLSKRSQRLCAARPMDSEGRAVSCGREAQGTVLYSESLSGLYSLFVKEINKDYRLLCLFSLRTAQ